MSLVWLFLMTAGLILGAAKGNASALTGAAIDSAREAVSVVIGLAGSMALFSGVLKVAEKAGVTRALAFALRPALRVLFPGVPRGSRAERAVAACISANMLGVGSAATPLGIAAMRELQLLNNEPGTASDPMCTLVALTTSSVTIVPTTVIALRARFGAADPADIVGCALLATTASTLVAIVLDRAARAAGELGSRCLRQSPRSRESRCPQESRRARRLRPGSGADARRGVAWGD